MHRLLLLLLALLLLAPVALWVATMAGADVYNPLSEEGLRRLMMQGADVFAPRGLGTLLMAFTALGMVEGSGMLRPKSAEERRALLPALVAVLIAALLYLALYLWPGSPVLSLSGHFKHSPLIHALPLYIALTLIAAALSYAVAARTLRTWADLADLIAYGLTHHAQLFYALLILLTLIP